MSGRDEVQLALILFCKVETNVGKSQAEPQGGASKQRSNHSNLCQVAELEHGHHKGSFKVC